MKVLALALALALAGCFPTAERWTKEGTTFERTETERATCTVATEKQAWNVWPRPLLRQCTVALEI